MTDNLKILALDGGGSKGFYSLGVLHEVEAKVGKDLVDYFDGFYGVSTGAIIAAGLSTGMKVSEIKKLYAAGIPSVMRNKSAKGRTIALNQWLEETFENKKFDAFKKFTCIVATSEDEKMPKLFKSSVDAAHATKSSFKAGFDYSIAEALLASCAALPFFSKAQLCNENTNFTLWDGGFCSNNPTIFAIIDGLKAFKRDAKNLAILNVGTGAFPQKKGFLEKVANLHPQKPAAFLSDLLEISSNTTAIITRLLLDEVPILRISGAHTDPSLETNFLEHDIKKLEKLYIKGCTDYRNSEGQFEKIFGL